MGETCGMRLIKHTVMETEKCKICQKIETKKRRLNKERVKVLRWHKEVNLDGVARKSLGSLQTLCESLEAEIAVLEDDRTWRKEDVISCEFVSDGNGESANESPSQTRRVPKGMCSNHLSIRSLTNHNSTRE